MGVKATDLGEYRGFQVIASSTKEEKVFYTYPTIELAEKAVHILELRYNYENEVRSMDNLEKRPPIRLFWECRKISQETYQQINSRRRADSMNISINERIHLLNFPFPKTVGNSEKPPKPPKPTKKQKKIAPAPVPLQENPLNPFLVHQTWLQSALAARKYAQDTYMDADTELHIVVKAINNLNEPRTITIRLHFKGQIILPTETPIGEIFPKKNDSVLKTADEVKNELIQLIDRFFGKAVN